MRKQNDLAAFIGELADRRHDLLDPGGVRHFAVLHRHVEIDAHQDAFSFDIGIVEAAKGRHESLKMKMWRALSRACPSPLRCRSCGWRSPIHCRTRPLREPAYRRSPWSDPCERPRNADRD